MAEPKDLRARLREEILALTEARGPGKSICPSDAARAIRPDDWNRFMNETRRVAIQMAEAGEIEILRKGKPVAPDAVRGVIRLRRPLTQL